MSNTDVKVLNDILKLDYPPKFDESTQFPTSAIPGTTATSVTSTSSAKFGMEILTTESAELILNQPPYSIMCHPVSGLITKDDSNQYDIYSYNLKKLEANSLVIDLLEYFIATNGELRNRRSNFIIPDENNVSSAYILEYDKPNFHARDILAKELQNLNNKTLHEKIKTILAKETLIPCYQAMYYSITFKYIGIKEISKGNLEAFKIAFGKISKKPPISASFSPARTLTEFYSTFIERIVSLLIYGNENINTFFKDEFYRICNGLKTNDDDSELLNKLTLLKKIRSITFPLLKNTELSKIDKEAIDFPFQYQFLVTRNSFLKFSVWLNQTFKNEIELLKNQVLKFSAQLLIEKNTNIIINSINNNSDNTNNSAIDTIPAQTKKLIELFSVLSYRIIIHSIAPNFYLDFLNHHPSIQKLNELITSTFKELSRWSVNRFNKVFYKEYFNAETLYSENRCIKDAVARILKYQILSQSRQTQHQIQGADYNALQTVFSHDKIISSLLESIPSSHLFKTYLHTLSLDFIIDFLITTNRLKLVIAYEDDITNKDKEWRDKWNEKINKLKPSKFYRILNGMYSIYEHSLPVLFSKLSSLVMQPAVKKLESQKAILFLKKYAKDQLEGLFLYKILNYMLYDDKTHLSDEIYKKLSFLYENTTYYTPKLLGFALGVYLTPNLLTQLLPIAVGNLTLDEIIQYFNRPKLHERESVIIYKPLKTKAQSLLNYYLLSKEKPFSIKDLAIKESYGKETSINRI